MDKSVLRRKIGIIHGGVYVSWILHKFICSCSKPKLDITLLIEINHIFNNRAEADSLDKLLLPIMVNRLMFLLKHKSSSHSSTPLINLNSS